MPRRPSGRTAERAAERVGEAGDSPVPVPLDLTPVPECSCPPARLLRSETLPLSGQVGGSTLLVFNEELRFPLFGLFSGAAFVDAGNTFTDDRGIVFGDLAVGAGFGLRIRTPLAPIRIDLGFPVRSNTGQTSVRWHFSIGQIF